MNDLYIYYQVRDADASALAPLVRAMQARLSLEHGVTAQLKRRPETTNGLQTWMEIYPAVRFGFDAALADAVAGAALAQLTSGKRHTEIFTDLSTCA